MTTDRGSKGSEASTQVAWFQPVQGGRTFGVANLTNDPTVRDWANYHNTSCWSPDGRYVCYTRYASNGEIFGTNEAAEVRIFDMHTYVAVVRKPDSPYLREAEGRVELIPGESHYETYGYYLLRDGEGLNAAPLRPGDTFVLSSGGAITAVAVEWSGVESLPSNALSVNAEMTLKVLSDAPGAFSWTWDQWTVDGVEVDLVKGLQSEEAVKEIHHRYDGVIAREWYNWGVITRHYDLNGDGKATRRLFYRQGKLFRREYYTSEGQHLSTEYFDSEGNVTEMLLYQEMDGKKVEYDHWWYDQGMPVRRIGRKPARRIEHATPVMYVRAGDQWVLQDYVGKQPYEAEVAAQRWREDHGLAEQVSK